MTQSKVCLTNTQLMTLLGRSSCACKPKRKKKATKRRASTKKRRTTKRSSSKKTRTKRKATPKRRARPTRDRLGRFKRKR